MVEYRRPRQRLPPEKAAYVLDFLPYGYPFGGPRGPVVQALGEEKFILMELRPIGATVAEIDIKVGERIQLIGSLEGNIFRFNRVLRYQNLTSTARAELPHIVRNIVEKREREFVAFFNDAQPLTKKVHMLELLKGVGKRTVWKIIEERRKKPFKSFEDIRNRVGIDPIKLVVNRILDELSQEQTYYLFVRPQPFERRFRYQPRG